MRLFSTFRRPVPRMLLAAIFLSGATVLLLEHGRVVEEMRDAGLPAVQQMRAAAERLAFLQEQQETMELQAMLERGSDTERIRLYVLPEEASADRMLAFFDVLFSYLEQKALLLHVTAVETGEPVPVALPEGMESLKAIPITFEADLTEEGVEELLHLLALAGALTVGDVLEASHIQELLLQTEAVNPSAITALEGLLSADLLQYAAEPKPFYEELSKAVGSEEAVTAMESVLERSKLPTAGRLFHAFGPVLQSLKLWPLRFFDVTAAVQTAHEDGTVHLALTVQAFLREQR